MPVNVCASSRHVPDACVGPKEGADAAGELSLDGKIDTTARACSVLTASPSRQVTASEGNGGRSELWVIAGATGTGKTALSLALAEACAGEIIIADSVQVYPGFDIGSAKIRPSEQRGIPHHLIDAFDPRQPISAPDFARAADAAIADVWRRGAQPIVVGGTGLWLRALLRGLVDMPTLDPDLRVSLTTRAAREGSAALHQTLGEVDPVSAARLHPNDTLRVIRALEVTLGTGKALSLWQAEHALGKPRYQTKCVLLLREGDNYDRDLAARAHAMLEQGWVAETRALRTQLGATHILLRAVGYRQINEHFSGKAPQDRALVDRIISATRRYARRQRLWFRGEPGFEHALRVSEALPTQALLDHFC